MVFVILSMIFKRPEKFFLNLNVVMSLWGAFYSNRTISIVFINSKINSDKYVDMLSDILPDASLITSVDNTLEQGNASINTFKIAKLWFETIL